ncbi:hypothetical protein [Cysteiniphilum marinum]|uniref:hypothetical protein n=1 Tax=Cysteiniphilum marinum TaxID=2774191 RepID=UPI00193AB887|nr:hypothetical protein [Cysteiniphilum marinum]
MSRLNLNKTVKWRLLGRLLLGVGMIFAAVSLSFAADDKNFLKWAVGIVGFFDQIKAFVQVVATVIGMWFVYSALQLFRKHHTTQGAQGEHVKHGSGHLLLGVFLMCLVRGIQMLQNTLGKDLGDGVKNKFVVNESIFSGNTPSPDPKTDD